MTRAALIYPHQLFADHPALAGAGQAVLVEEPLFFTQYAFHRQKLILHRATMTRYAEALRRRGLEVHHVEAGRLADTASVAGVLKRRGVRSVRYVDPCDDWLSARLASALARQGIAAEVLDDPHFLTPASVIRDFTEGKERLYFTEFYVAQRKRLGLLLDGAGKPLGGKWSFDPANRRKLPRGTPVPATHRPDEGEAVGEARRYVRGHFRGAPGSDEAFGYPTDHAAAAAWLADFVRDRLGSFGDYEDAISTRHDVLFHSVLTPMLNVGLLSPRQVLDAALARAGAVPLNSLEGFVRQVAGWREFVRLVYLARGRAQRTRNFWGFTHPVPAAFYDGSTGIGPVDHVIAQVLRRGYCHHIERLMVLGNFMLLCEIHPDGVYRWFMELFVDAYDWVMAPNVYGMSQHADGGLMTTKPYISGSSYVLKMSDFPRGPWCATWDALYWRFVDRHADFFAANPRMAVMAKMRDKLGNRLQEHLRVADAFLGRLHHPPG
jgi:deoxyribodipyrimidine photolyase-related protein